MVDIKCLVTDRAFLLENWSVIYIILNIVFEVFLFLDHLSKGAASLSLEGLYRKELDKFTTFGEIPILESVIDLQELLDNEGVDIDYHKDRINQIASP